MDAPACLRIVVFPPTGLFAKHCIKVQPGDRDLPNVLFQPSSDHDEALVLRMMCAPQHPWQQEDTEQIELLRTCYRGEVLLGCGSLLRKMRERSEEIWSHEFAKSVFECFDPRSVQVLDSENIKTVLRWAFLYEEKHPLSSKPKVTELIQNLMQCHGQSDTTSWTEEVERPLGNKSALTFNTKRIHLIADRLLEKSCRTKHRDHIEALRQCANAEQIFLRDQEEENIAKFQVLLEAQKRVNKAWEDLVKNSVADIKALSVDFVQAMNVMWNAIFGPDVYFPEIGHWEKSLPYRRCSSSLDDGTI